MNYRKNKRETFNFKLKHDYNLLENFKT